MSPEMACICVVSSIFLNVLFQVLLCAISGLPMVHDHMSMTHKWTWFRPAQPFINNPVRLAYSWNYLLELSRLQLEPVEVSHADICLKLCQGHKWKQIGRKRGTRGGIRNRLPSPAITLWNVQSGNWNLPHLSSPIRTIVNPASSAS